MIWLTNFKYASLRKQPQTWTRNWLPLRFSADRCRYIRSCANIAKSALEAGRGRVKRTLECYICGRENYFAIAGCGGAARLSLASVAGAPYVETGFVSAVPVGTSRSTPRLACLGVEKGCKSEIYTLLRSLERRKLEAKVLGEAPFDLFAVIRNRTANHHC